MSSLINYPLIVYPEFINSNGLDLTDSTKIYESGGAASPQDETGIPQPYGATGEWVDLQKDEESKKIHHVLIALNGLWGQIDTVRAQFAEDRSVFGIKVSDAKRAVVELRGEPMPTIESQRRAQDIMVALFPYYNAWCRQLESVLKFIEAQHLPDAPNFVDLKERITVAEKAVNGGTHGAYNEAYWTLERILSTSHDEFTRLIFAEEFKIIDELKRWITQLERMQIEKKNAEVRDIVSGSEAKSATIDSLRAQRNGAVALILIGALAATLDRCSPEPSHPTVSASTASKNTVKIDNPSDTLTQEIPTKDRSVCIETPRFSMGAAVPYFDDTRCREGEAKLNSQGRTLVRFDCPEAYYTIKQPPSGTLLPIELEQCTPKKGK